jgi:tRNA (cmo5U34)-methyltransferase
MTDTTETFDRHARDYDAMRRRLIPPFDEFYGTAVAAAGPAPRHILDLGAGTGLLSRMLIEAYPDADLTLLDGAPAMLEQARASLGDRAQYVVGDLTDPIPENTYDVVVSALAIHHLPDRRKKQLFATVFAAAPKFINAEQVAGPYRDWHHDEAIRLGATEDDWAAAVERMRHDKLATVDDQLAWLREAGFASAECAFQDHCFAVLVARRG